MQQVDSKAERIMREERVNFSSFSAVCSVGLVCFRKKMRGIALSGEQTKTGKQARKQRRRKKIKGKKRRKTLMTKVITSCAFAVLARAWPKHLSRVLLNYHPWRWDDETILQSDGDLKMTCRNNLICLLERSSSQLSENWKSFKLLKFST